MAQPRRTGPVTDVIALVMLVTSLVISLTLVGPLVRAGEVPLMVLLTLGLLGYRLWLVRHPDSHRVRHTGYWVSLAFAAALVYISPLYGAYAFIGYLELPRYFHGWRRILALLLTAMITAGAQIGGPRGYFASWPIYGILLTVNCVVVAVVVIMEHQRERTLTELEQTVAELRAAEQLNASLQAQLVSQARDAGVQDERARLSREIHDTVAQGLVGIMTQLEAADPAAPDVGVRIDRARTAARDALGEARRAVRALASPRLDDELLPGALTALVRQVGQSTGLDARFVLTGEAVPTGADAELLRITQEALSNVTRHADATRVVVTLGYEPDEVRLDVRDDGRGFDPATAQDGRGLPGMRERLVPHGGRVEIETSEGGGCTVGAVVPI